MGVMPSKGKIAGGFFSASLQAGQDFSQLGGWWGDRGTGKQRAGQSMGEWRVTGKTVGDNAGRAGQILEGNLSGKLPGCSPARAVCAVPAPGPGWGSGDTAALTGTWGTEHLPTRVVLPWGTPCCHTGWATGPQTGSRGWCQGPGITGHRVTVAQPAPDKPAVPAGCAPSLLMSPSPSGMRQQEILVSPTWDQSHHLLSHAG